MDTAIQIINGILGGLASIIGAIAWLLVARWLLGPLTIRLHIGPEAPAPPAGLGLADRERREG